jgi:predicted metal-binding protein
MTRVGIIICARYQNCGGGKCLRAMREHVGGFARYAEDEELQLVGYAACGGCPGGNVEHVPEEMIRNGAEAIHLATGLVVGYPPCPHLRSFKEFIEVYYETPVVVGTHPIPLKYRTAHAGLPFWREAWMEELAGELINEDPTIMKAYD